MYKIGDKVHVSNASGAVQDLEVIAVSDAYGYFPHPDERLYGVTSDKFMKRAFCIDVDTLNECAVVLERSDILACTPGTSSRSARASRPRSWARQSASVKSSSNPRTLASVREICATSMVCVSRLRK